MTAATTEPTLSDAAAAASLYARRATQAAEFNQEALENAVRAASDSTDAANNAGVQNPFYAAMHHYDAAVLHDRAAAVHEGLPGEGHKVAAEAHRKAAEMHRRASGQHLVTVKEKRDAKNSRTAPAVTVEVAGMKSMGDEPAHLLSVEAHAASSPVMDKTPSWLVYQLTQGSNDYGYHGTAYDCSKGGDCVGAMLNHDKQASLHDTLAKMMRNGIMAGGDSTAGQHEVAADLHRKACAGHCKDARTQGGLDGSM